MTSAGLLADIQPEVYFCNSVKGALQRVTGFGMLSFTKEHYRGLPMTVYAYTRVSTSEQASDDKTSLASQRAKIVAIAAAAGLTVDVFVEEPGVSGAKPMAERPAGGPMFASLTKGDTLIVAKLDRAFRNAGDALTTGEQLKARKVDLILADMGSEPVTQNGVSRMFFGMLALVAEFERDRFRERVGDGRVAKRAAGGHIGGSTPFGYQKVGAGKAAKLVPDAEQQAALETMRSLKRQGLASRPIAAAVLAQHGIKISHVAVNNALSRDAAA